MTVSELSVSFNLHTDDVYSPFVGHRRTFRARLSIRMRPNVDRSRVTNVNNYYTDVTDVRR
jgi:hypothetical protein